MKKISVAVDGGFKGLKLEESLELVKRCGFDAVGERVFVQYYPEKHGGCEMFVTKIGLLDDSYGDKKDMNGYEKLASQIKKNKKTKNFS